jgi:hypothetical protein
LTKKKLFITIVTVIVPLNTTISMTVMTTFNYSFPLRLESPKAEEKAAGAGAEKAVWAANFPEQGQML